MSGDSKVDKQRTAEMTQPPRMLGDTDVGVILQLAESLPDGAAILEVGPWLGGLTRELARFGKVTVADRFIWSEANAASHPGLAEADTSFLPMFEAFMAAEGIKVDVVVTELPAMSWDGGALDFVVIDAPRDVAGLHGCLRAIAPSLRDGARIMVKHALNPRNFGMGAYLDALIGLGYAQIVPTEQPDWCNIAAIAVTGQIAALASVDDPGALIASAPVSDGFTDPWYGHRLTTFRLAHLAQEGRWQGAYDILGQMAPRSENLTLWDEFSVQITSDDTPAFEAGLAVLSDLVWVQNDASASAPAPIGPSVTQRLRAYWINNAAHPERAKGLAVEALCDEALTPVIEALGADSAYLFRKSVVATGKGLHHLATIASLAGATAFLGLLPQDAELPDEAAKDTDLTGQRIIRDEARAAAALAQADVLVVSGNDPLPDALADTLAARKAEAGSDFRVIHLNG